MCRLLGAVLLRYNTAGVTHILPPHKHTTPPKILIIKKRSKILYNIIIQLPTYNITDNLINYIKY